MGDSKPSIEQNDSGLSYTRQSLLKPHPARMYAFMVGGKDHYRVDRDAVEQLLKAEPASKDIARANLAFVRRAASYLAAETHIRQVIDFGAGLPVDDYIHDRMPDARVVYADNDLMVLGHLGVHRPQKRLLTISGDLTEPEALLRNQQVQALIDFTEPVAIFACAVLHFIAADPAPIVARLREVMVPGSALVISHGTADDAKDAATAEGPAAHTTAPPAGSTRAPHRRSGPCSMG
ncbi:SAM-dependent methyltransferase [Thermocatellispora tengchongensis]|uniref:SAM-dependent methyltransferase n=1 Tax=Thermocatellispora tengchongensis TaxID=1073253 RepID=UPI0036299DDD